MWEEIPEQQEDRQVCDTMHHQEMHRVRLGKARYYNHNLVQHDDTDFFQEQFNGNYRQTLTKISLFQCLKCSHCGAFVRKEERRGFCCRILSSPVRLTLLMTPLIPNLALSHHSLQMLLRTISSIRTLQTVLKQYNNVLAMAFIGVWEIPMPGFNPGVHIQGKVYHYIAGPLP